MTSSSSSKNLTRWNRIVSNGAYHSRSQCVCGTTTAVTPVVRAGSAGSVLSAPLATDSTGTSYVNIYEIEECNTIEVASELRCQDGNRSGHRCRPGHLVVVSAVAAHARQYVARLLYPIPAPGLCLDLETSAARRK